MRIMRTLGYSAVVLTGICGGFFSGYYSRDSEKPRPIIISTCDNQLKTRNEELTKELDETTKRNKELLNFKLYSEKQLLQAEISEAKKKKELEMKPYDLEKTNAVLEARLRRLEGEKEAHLEVDLATKAKYEAEIAKIQTQISQKETYIAGLEGKLAINSTQVEKIKAQYEKVLAERDRDNTRLLRVIEDAKRNGYNIGITKN